jgi:HAD superfamily hydrolase (TIGR01509 family)
VTALLFDCDGVLADTERDGHLPAFNQAFAEFGLPVQWSEEEYGRRLQIGGGKERIRCLLTPEFVSAAGLPTDADAQAELVERWHRRKTEIFTEMVRSGAIAPRPGVERIARAAAAAGWKQAVASTSAIDSVRAVLEAAVGADLAARFSVFAGDVVPRKKPSPDIYLLALRELGTPAADAVVIEDSRNGLLAAAGAGIGCVITLSTYTQHEDMTGAALVVSDLGDPGSPDIGVQANHTGTPVRGYVSLPTISACRRIADTTYAPGREPWARR